MSESSSPWPWIRLKDLVAEMCLGKMLDKAKNQGTPQPYLGNINVRWFSFDLSELKEMRFEEDEVERFGLRSGDLVVCEGGEPGRASVWNGQAERMMIQKALHRIRFFPEVYDPYFGMYFIYYGTTTNRFADLYTGTTIKHLTGTALAEVRFPLPPLPEQQRIVEKIEELFSDLDAGVASLERAKTNLKRYRASVLKSAVQGKLTEEWRKEHPHAEDGQILLDRILRERREKWEKDQLAQFKKKGKEPPKKWQSKYGEPSAPDTSELPELPEGWVWATVEQVAHTATGGTPDRKNPDYFGGGIPWVKSGELGDGYVHETEETLTALGVEESNAKVFPKGTLCIALYGATVGKLGILEMDATTNQAVCGIFLPSEVRREYLSHYLTLIRPKLVEQGKGGAQSNISNGLVRVTVFPLPPLAEQEQIVALVEERLSQLDSAEKTIDAELIRSKRLRQSILKRAFEGKLVPQDPKDEPASILLERIKTSREAEQPQKKAKKVKARAK